MTGLRRNLCISAKCNTYRINGTNSGNNTAELSTVLNCLLEENASLLNETAIPLMPFEN